MLLREKYTEDCTLINAEQNEFYFHLYSNVQPDFFLFHTNPYKLNDKETQVVGYPDLIVEVWSETNDIYERVFKQYLYGTSDLTEHWYLRQDTNIVKCFKGRTELVDKSLDTIMYTTFGLKFDLRDLQIK